MSSKVLILCAAILAGASAASWPAESRAADAEKRSSAGQSSKSQCLTPAQRRNVASTGKVVPLGKAIHAAKARRSEVVDAKLCKGPKGLVYRLTLLSGDGKVTRATIDAASGLLAEGG